MSKLYIGNSRHNKAAAILSSMSDDMISDIVDLVSSRGRNVISDISSNRERGLSPLAIFSRSLMTDDDFDMVWLGYNTVQIASMRTLKSDFDFYESTLKNAFGLPSEMAAALAKTIETYDIIGVTSPGQPTPAWYSNLGNQIAEKVRQISNWSMDILHLPFENDQDQKYDIDFLYELRLLGKAVDELNARSRLMNAQASISAGMGLFKPGEAGDIENDPSYAPALIGDVFSPLLLSSLPKMIFGRFDKVSQMGRLASSAKAKRVTAAAGITGKAPLNSSSVAVDPSISSALQSAMNGDYSALTDLSLKSSPDKIVSLMQSYKRSLLGGDVMGDISESIGDIYGDAVGQAWAAGDIQGVISGIGELADDQYTTGDPDLDQQIIGDVLAELSQTGDLSYGDPEIGGLLKRARINAALRKGNRIKRKGVKKVARAQKRANEDARLANARKRADSFRATTERNLAAIRPVIPQDEIYEEDEELDPNEGWTDEEEFMDTESQLEGFQ